jgi:hypothetical protein
MGQYDPSLTEPQAQRDAPNSREALRGDSLEGPPVPDVDWMPVVAVGLAQ